MHYICILYIYFSILNWPCVVSCPDLEAPSSGDIVVATDGQVSTVNYTCADNYEVHGDVTQQCQTDGTWSGSNTTCGNNKTDINTKIFIRPRIRGCF